MTFTYEDVIEAAREVVAEKGAEYVYREDHARCRYTEHDGEPACIVGHVVHRLDAEAFLTLAAIEATRPYSTDARGLASLLGEDFWDREAANAMSYAQQVQDSGFTWGYALAEAESVRIPA